jgi:acetyl-CoA acetyltransferase
LALATSKVQEDDALFLGVMNPEEFTGYSNIASMVPDSMGLTGIRALRVETASSAGAAAFVTAVHAVVSGNAIL